MAKLGQIVFGLNTYHGRDACIKFLAYFSLFIYGTILKDFDNKNAYKMADPFLSLSKQFSNCRIVLRFLEDLPAFYNIYKFSFIEKVSSLIFNKFHEKKQLFFNLSLCTIQFFAL
jgi:hypothetical protein